MEQDQREYHAYLLRLWRVNASGALLWRASLEDPHTGERKGFADLASLFAFLDGEVAPPGPGSLPPEGPA
jgi:hypothetical protein